MLFFRDFRLGVLLNFLKQRHIMDFLLWTRYQRYKLEISFFITRVYCNQYYWVRVFVRRYVSPVYKHSVQTHLLTFHSFQDEESSGKKFGAFRGMILRSQLIVLLKHKVMPL